MSRKAQTVHAPTNGWRPGFDAGDVTRSRILGNTRRDSTHNTISVGGSTMSILAWIVFGGLAGLVASLLTGGGGGMIFDIVVGIVGAVLRGFLMKQFGQSGVTGWNWPSFGVAVVGAIMLLVILRMVRGGGCLLYTSDAADDLLCVDLGGRRIIKKKKKKNKKSTKTN